MLANQWPILVANDVSDAKLARDAAVRRSLAELENLVVVSTFSPERNRVR